MQIFYSKISRVNKIDVSSTFSWKCILVWVVPVLEIVSVKKVNRDEKIVKYSKFEQIVEHVEIFEQIVEHVEIFEQIVEHVEIFKLDQDQNLDFILT